MKSMFKLVNICIHDDQLCGLFDIAIFNNLTLMGS